MKDSEIEWFGKIPEHWNEPSVSRLKQMLIILDFQDGNHGELHPKVDDFTDTGKPFLTAEQIDEFGNIDFDNANRLPEEFCKKLRIGFSYANDILFTHNATVGRVAIMPPNAPDSIIGTSITYYRLDVERLNQIFFSFLMNSDYISSQYEPIMKQTTRNQFSILKQAKLKILLPNIDEQKNIADFLIDKTKKIDNEVLKNIKLIEFLKEKHQVMINNAVIKGIDPNVTMKNSGIEWIGNIPEHWKISRLKYVVKDMIAGPFGSSIKKEYYVKKGYKVYGQEQVISDDFTIGDYYISEEKFYELKRFEIKTDDILISCVGTLGQISVVPKSAEPGIINPRLIKLTPNSKICNSNYVYQYLKSHAAFSQFEKYGRGGTMDIINQTIIGLILLPLPPIDEQHIISHYIIGIKHKFNNLLTTVETQIEKLRECRQSLISSAVSGKIDIRETQSIIQ